MFRLCSLLLVTLTCLNMLSCNVPHISTRSANANAEANPQASLALFEEHVHPLFKEMKCNTCHTSKGTGNGAFADDDVSVAHEAAIAEDRVDFGDITSSKFITKQENAHNCSGKCDSNVTKLTEALTIWQEERGGTSNTYAFTTKAIDPNPDNTNDYDKEKITFALESLMEEDKVGRVTLAVEVSKSNSATLLTIDTFKLTTSDNTIFMKGIRAKRNGKLSTDQTLNRACVIAQPGDGSTDIKGASTLFDLSNDTDSPQQNFLCHQRTAYR